MSTADEFDNLLYRQPPNLPALVARVTADGQPTKHLLDWEQFQRNWFKTSVVNLNTRLVEVRSDTDGNSAAIIEETIARTTADEALAEQITTVTATVGDFTAQGQIRFAAKATPAGAVAAYGLFLTAGNAFTGFEMIAKSDGTAAIGFSANQFYLNDSGTAQNVFTYFGGIPKPYFQFNVPVKIRTLDIATRAVTAPVIATAGNVVTISGDTDWTTILSVSAAGVADTVAVVYVDFEYQKFQSGTGILGGEYRVRRNDGEILRSAALGTPATYSPVNFARLDADFEAAYTYSLQVRCFVGTPGTGDQYFSFRTRSLMIDMRKR